MYMMINLLEKYYSNLKDIQNSKNICKSNGVPVDSKETNDPSATKQRLQENSSFNKTPVLCMYKLKHV